MPTYEYKCVNGHFVEQFQSINDQPLTKCPECGQETSRQIGGGSGLMFKGSGFYVTDYRKPGHGSDPKKSTDTKKDSSK